MAIVKMKKLQAIALARQKDTLLRELQRLGCVELKTQDWAEEDETAAALVEDGTYVSLAEKYGLDTANLCLAK